MYRNVCLAAVLALTCETFADTPKEAVAKADVAWTMSFRLCIEPPVQPGDPEPNVEIRLTMTVDKVKPEADSTRSGVKKRGPSVSQELLASLRGYLSCIMEHVEDLGSMETFSIEVSDGKFTSSGTGPGSLAADLMKCMRQYVTDDS